MESSGIGTGTAQDAGEAAELGMICAAIADDLALLARVHDRELDGASIAQLRDREFPQSLCLGHDDDAVQQGAALVRHALEAIGPADQDELASDFAAIYLNHGCGASPCESVWLDDDGLALQEPMFQVRRWYRRHGLGVPNWRMRSDDHLVVQLHFLQHLLREASHDGLEQLARFMDEHLLRWLPGFATRVAARCATPFYAGTAMLTAAYCQALRELLAQILDQPRPSAEEIEQRMKPKPRREAVPIRFVPGVEPTW